MSTSKRLGCLGAVLFFLLCMSLLANVVLLSTSVATMSPSIARSAPAPRLSEMRVEPGKGAGKIALIDLQGIISTRTSGQLGDNMVSDLKIALRQAEKDRSVKALVVRIDSPGGEVTASDIIFNEIRRLRDKKPVVIYMQSVAASGGYYAACGGSYLMAHETTLTGSIGVIISTLKYRDLFGKVGLESIVFKSGKFKDMLSGARDMTDEEKEYVQGMVMQIYDKFVGIVAEERDLPLDELKEGVADGRVVSGMDALQYRLVDEVGLVEDAFEKARELGEAPDAPVVRYVAPFNLGNLFRLFGSSTAKDGKLEIDISERLWPRLEAGRFYLLPGIYAP